MHLLHFSSCSTRIQVLEKTIILGLKLNTFMVLVVLSADYLDLDGQKIPFRWSWAWRCCLLYRCYCRAKHTFGLENIYATLIPVRDTVGERPHFFTTDWSDRNSAISSFRWKLDPYVPVAFQAHPLTSILFRTCPAQVPYWCYWKTAEWYQEHSAVLFLIWHTTSGHLCSEDEWFGIHSHFFPHFTHRTCCWVSYTRS